MAETPEQAQARREKWIREFRFPCDEWDTEDLIHGFCKAMEHEAPIAHTAGYREGLEAALVAIQGVACNLIMKPYAEAVWAAVEAKRDAALLGEP